MGTTQRGSASKSAKPNQESPRKWDNAEGPQMQSYGVTAISTITINRAAEPYAREHFVIFGGLGWESGGDEGISHSGHPNDLPAFMREARIP
jgi:hypothetical protein